MRNILENIKQMLLRDNTSNTTLWDKISAIKSDDMVDLDVAIKAMEQRHNREAEQKAQQDQQQQQAMQEHQAQMQQQQQQFEAEQKQLDRDTRIQEAQIRAAGFSGAVDLNQNQQNDYLDNMKFLESQRQSTDKMNLERDKHITDTRLEQTYLDIQRQKIAEQSKRTTAQLQVAKINNKVKDKNKKS
jgi:hypothetical protein